VRVGERAQERHHVVDLADQQRRVARATCVLDGIGQALDLAIVKVRRRDRHVAQGRRAKAAAQIVMHGKVPRRSGVAAARIVVVGTEQVEAAGLQVTRIAQAAAVG
jgi:hypothetical protein